MCKKTFKPWPMRPNGQHTERATRNASSRWAHPRSNGQRVLACIFLSTSQSKRNEIDEFGYQNGSARWSALILSRNAKLTCTDKTNKLIKQHRLEYQHKYFKKKQPNSLVNVVREPSTKHHCRGRSSETNVWGQ
jgi:hypothetical protein